MDATRPFDGITHLTFDCYGTLIDWETGILDAALPLLRARGVDPRETDVLRAFVDAEASLEAGAYRPYRDVLHEAMRAIGARFGLALGDADCATLPASLANWPPFADSADALARLADRYTLVVVSNVDDALFAASALALGSPFTHVVTAQQVGRYKPDHRMFEAALQRAGVARERVLHVAQSLYHDHVPAQALGIRSLHVVRPSRLDGTGLAPDVAARPDATARSMAEVADLLLPR